MNMLTLLYFVSIKQPKNKGYPQNPIKSVATPNTTHQEYTLKMTYNSTTLFLQTVKNIYFSSTSRLLVLSTPEKHQYCGIYKTVWFEHENTFQNYQGEKATHTIQNES